MLNMNILYLGPGTIIRAKLKVYRTQAQNSMIKLKKNLKVSWKKCNFAIQQINVMLMNFIAGTVSEKKNDMLFKNRKSKILCLVKNNPLQKYRLRSK